MSQENVDLFKEFIEGCNRIDIAGLLRLIDPEIRFDPDSASWREATPSSKACKSSSRMSSSTSTG